MDNRQWIMNVSASLTDCIICASKYHNCQLSIVHSQYNRI